MKNQKGQMMIVVIIAVVIIGAYFMSGGFFYKPPKPLSGQPVEVDTSEATSSSSIQSSNATLVCTHSDGICRPNEEFSCCPNLRVFCENAKCKGVLPPGDTQNTTVSSITIDTQCAQGLDQICKSTCGNKEGFTCF